MDQGYLTLRGFLSQPGIGPSDKTVLTIYLSKAALHIRTLNDPSFDVTESTRRRTLGAHPITLNLGARVRRPLHSRGVEDPVEPVPGPRRHAP